MDNTLKLRIITASLLAGGFITALYLVPTGIMALVLAVFLLLGGWEWTRLIGLKQPVARILFLVVLGLLLWFGWQYLQKDASIFNTMVLAACWWLLALLWVSSYPMGAAPLLVNQVVKIFAGLLVLMPAWVGMVKLLQHSPHWLLYIMILIWVADSGAYFAGRAWGKRKLAPKVSPGKSWEGVYGALVVSAIYAVIGSFWLEIKSSQLAAFIIISVLMVPVSILGDLFESMIKRHGEFKDSGTLLPGHGGVLDRIDSITSTIPVFTLAVMWMGWIQ